MSCLLQGDVTLQARILPSTEASLITLPGLHNTKKPVATSLMMQYTLIVVLWSGGYRRNFAPSIINQQQKK